jgi:hypothetical protein
MTCIYAYVQIHVPIIRLDSSQEFVIVTNVYQHLCITLDGLVQDGKGARFQICGMLGLFWLLTAHGDDDEC